MATDCKVRKGALTFFSFFDRVISMLAGNDNVHKSLAEFEIRPDPTKAYGFSRP